MMNSRDSDWVLLWERPADEVLSIWVASWPVRWAWSPVAPAGNAARMPSTTAVASGPALNDTTSAWTRAWRAAPSADTPKSMTTLTWATVRIVASSWSMVALSAAVSPPSRATTSVALASDEFWKGEARAAACMLGALSGRKPLVVSLATSLIDGRRRTAPTVPTIQITTIRNRKRTAVRPSAVKKPSMEFLSESIVDPSSIVDPAPACRRRVAPNPPIAQDIYQWVYTHRVI